MTRNYINNQANILLLIRYIQLEMKYENIPLSFNESEHRFELTVENHKGFIDYKKSGNKMYLVHTEVDEELEGKGVASALVEKTLQYLEDHNYKLVPLCSYVRTFLQKHPEWNKLVADDHE